MRTQPFSALIRYFLYAAVITVFLAFGVFFSFGIHAFAQVAGYPVGVLEGAQSNWSCDSGYTLVSFRRNTGSTFDADWWACEDSGEQNN